jgi:hypothetical protein
MSPPAAMPLPRPGGSCSTAKQIDEAINATHAILRNIGIPMSASAVSRLVRQYERRVRPNRWSFVDYLVNRLQLSVEQRRQLECDPEYARVIGYSDPTGENAVNNVLRQTAVPSELPPGAAPPCERAQVADPAPRNHFASRATRFNTIDRREAEPWKATAPHDDKEKAGAVTPALS